jgi:hypothetical protein
MPSRPTSKSVATVLGARAIPTILCHRRSLQVSTGASTAPPTSGDASLLKSTYDTTPNLRAGTNESVLVSRHLRHRCDFVISCRSNCSDSYR